MSGTPLPSSTKGPGVGGCVGHRQADKPQAASGVQQCGRGSGLDPEIPCVP